jgi:hypothetical protein
MEDDVYEEKTMAAQCTGCGAISEECGASFMGWPHNECTNPEGGTWYEKESE